MAKRAKGTFMGVCATLSNKSGVDVFLIRFTMVLSLLFTGGIALLIYIILGLFAIEK